MDRRKVKSSLIASVGFEEPTLEIEFNPKANQITGAVYQYTPFTLEDFKEFRRAQSIGQYFTENIKQNERFTFKRVAEPQEKTVPYQKSNETE